MASHPKKISSPKEPRDYMRLLRGSVRSLPDELREMGGPLGLEQLMKLYYASVRSLPDELREMGGPLGREQLMKLYYAEEDVRVRYSYRVEEYNNAASGQRGKPDYSDLFARASEIHRSFTHLRHSAHQDVAAPAPDHGAGGSSASKPSPDPPRAEVEEGISGMEGPSDILVKWLQDEEKRMQVVSIVGPAGSGKAMLANKVYEELCGKFDCHAKVRVSRWQDPMDLLKQILSQVLAKNQQPEPEDWEQPQLVRRIREHLRDKRYFILIEGIWDKKCWEVIHSVFPKGNLSSRVMMTTRVNSVARSCRSHRDGLVYEMKPLSKEYSETLLRRDMPSSDELRQASEEIWRKYDGNPLAIKTIADMMSEQEQTSMIPWLQDLCKPGKIPNLNRLKEVCSHSYGDLDFPKELCLVYMSLFPGYRIEKDRLLRRWVAEGFVTSESDMTETVEEKAQQYLSEFMDRNIIRTERRICHSGVETWKADCLMLQVMLSNSSHKDYMITSDTLHPAKNQAQRLSLHRHDPQLDTLLETMDLSSTHSLTISNPVLRVHLSNFTHLQVLDVEGWTNFVDTDMLNICKMHLLKYLSIRKTSVSILPTQIKQLHKLETLDVRETKVTQLPDELCEINTLKTLDLRNTKIQVLPEKVSQLQGLLNLLVGDDDDVDKNLKVPQWIYKVRSLKTLATVDFSGCSSVVVKNLGHLTNLRELAIIWSFHQSSKKEFQDALRSSIRKLRMLKYLTMYTDFNCSMEFLDCDLPDLPQKLEKLLVAGRFVTVPQWVERLQDLAFLKVTVCKLEGKDMEILADLRRLRCLELGLEFYPEQEIIVENVGFRVLERFCVDCRVPWLTFEAGAMPQLTELELKFFSGLTGQETVLLSGISNLLSLEQVVLQHSKLYGNDSVVKAIKTEVLKHRNLISLFINNTEDEGKASSTAEPSPPPGQEITGRRSLGAEGDADSDTVLVEASNPLKEVTRATINKDGKIVGDTSESANVVTISSSEKWKHKSVKHDINFTQVATLLLISCLSNQLSMITDDGKSITEIKGKKSNHENPTLPTRRQATRTKTLGAEKNAKKEERAQQPEWHPAAMADEGYRSGLAYGHNNVVRGMQNMGNTCHFNVALQSLLAVDKLRMYMLEKGPPSGTIHLELKKLFEETRSASNAGSTLVPKELFKYMCKKYKDDFSLGKIGDSSDALRCLINGLRDEERNDRKRMPGMVDSLFYVSVVKTVSCEQCGPSSEPGEELDLLLPIPKESASIQDCLKLYTDGKRDWECSKCKKVHKDVKEKTLIRKAPPVLILQLKRYEYVETPKKLEKQVRFKETLDIKNFIEDSPGENVHCNYHLAAVIAHKGHSLNEGHYIAYVKASRVGGQQQEIGGSCSWFLADDAVVTGCERVEDVLGCEAYILLYERVEG